MFNRLNKVSHVIEGGAPGADEIARDWAKQRNVPNTTYNAEWSKHGPSAGPIRNGRMLEDNPDIEFVIALPGGRGTANMIEQAQAKGISVIKFSKPASK